MPVKRNIIPVFIPHLGCPHDCVFCNQRKISGQTKPATPESVSGEIRSGLLKAPNGDTQVAFYGGSFTAIPAAEQEALLGAALPFLHSGAISSLRVSTRPDAIDGGVIERLRRCGVKTVELGVQSMDETVLKMSNRGHTAEDAEKAAKMLKAAGFELILQMMTGLPGDTLEKSLYTACSLAALAPDGVRIYPTVIIKDTRLFEMAKSGEYCEHTVDEAVSWCAEILEVFKRENIPVIRLGLNPTDDLSAGEAVGGAYHPALGELVYAEMCFNAEKKLIGDDARDAAYVEFEVPRGRMSQAVGQHGKNRRRLHEQYNIKQVKFVESPASDGEIKLINIAKNG